MQAMQRRKLPVFINAAAGLAMLSGFILYGRLIAASDGAWAATSAGMTFGIGAVAMAVARYV